MRAIDEFIRFVGTATIFFGVSFLIYSFNEHRKGLRVREARRRIIEFVSKFRGSTPAWPKAVEPFLAGKPQTYKRLELLAQQIFWMLNKYPRLVPVEFSKALDDIRIAAASAETDPDEDMEAEPPVEKRRRPKHIRLPSRQASLFGD